MSKEIFSTAQPSPTDTEVEKMFQIKVRRMELIAQILQKEEEPEYSFHRDADTIIADTSGLVAELLDLE